ncbi:hypothetical protein [Cronobacter turicensis]|uniref:hypothetical protein n=1 Tax=Cronobacter turicensis TaxID=413502 RepID=UPI0024AF97AE|nr:hypothetical protein [Cronobacter turicensis]MDI7416589.1 hypothetical protein [Cronobacter turicensis]MDI7496514.1 hypothetical protein [Cronobacter turicensis]
MSNFNIHYLEDANFKVAISEIEEFINHYYRGIFYVRCWHKAEGINTIQLSLIFAQSGTTRCLDAAWCDGHQHQRAGVVLGKVISQRMAQLNMFDEDALRSNSKALMYADKRS